MLILFQIYLCTETLLEKVIRITSSNRFFTNDSDDGVENQVFGISKKGERFLAEYVIPATLEEIAGGSNGWIGHRNDFNRETRKKYGVPALSIYAYIPDILTAKSTKSSYQVSPT